MFQGYSGFFSCGSVQLVQTFLALVWTKYWPFSSFFLQFTFGKVWLLYAQFEIRQKDLKAARQALVSRTHST